MKTKKFERVLIALDYDQTAQNVADSGFALARTMGASVILLHIISDPVYYSSTEYSPITGFTGLSNTVPWQMDNIEDLKKATQYYLDKIKQNLGDDTIETHVEDGDFAESILRAAKTTKADIIVMGSHSRKWLEDIVMGSVTEKVLHHTTLPLFIIPTKKQKQ